MTFPSPTPLADALALLKAKRLVPTSLSSADLRELEAEVKNAALFSARMTQIRPLQALMSGLTAMLAGEGNLADAKLLLAQVYAAMGYDPEAGGFPQDAPGTVPPALRGSLRDLSSQKRMELTITTNYRMVTNAAFVKRTTDDEQRRYQFPCYELVRIAPRHTPRGMRRRDGVLTPKPGDDWPSRFVAAGGELYEKGTRMIAIKGSDVWVKLGEGAGGYTDTLGNPFAPFAFGSGYGLRELPRGECLLIGVITEDDQAAAMPATLSKALKAQAKQVPKDILDAFDDLEDDGEWLRLAKARQLKAEAARSGARNRAAVLAEMLTNAGRRSKRIRTHTRILKTKHEFREDEWQRVGGKFAGYVGPRRVESVKDLLAKLKDNPEADLMAHVMMLDGRVGASMSKAFGADVRGWELVLHSSDYRHAQKNHADEVGAQWLSIPSIISRADHIISSGRTNSGERAVEVWKKDGTWLKLVLAEGKDRKVKVKTFKRRQELFNRLDRALKSGCWIASAVPFGSGALTSVTTQTAIRNQRERCQRPRPHAQGVSDPHAKSNTLRARCKLLAALLHAA